VYKVAYLIFKEWVNVSSLSVQISQLLYSSYFKNTHSILTVMIFFLFKNNPPFYPNPLFKNQRIFFSFNIYYSLIGSSILCKYIFRLIYLCFIFFSLVLYDGILGIRLYLYSFNSPWVHHGDYLVS